MPTIITPKLALLTDTVLFWWFWQYNNNDEDENNNNDDEDDEKSNDDADASHLAGPASQPIMKVKVTRPPSPCSLSSHKTTMMLLTQATWQDLRLNLLAVMSPHSPALSYQVLVFIICLPGPNPDANPNLTRVIVLMIFRLKSLFETVFSKINFSARLSSVRAGLVAFPVSTTLLKILIMLCVILSIDHQHHLYHRSLASSSSLTIRIRVDILITKASASWDDAQSSIFHFDWARDF